MKRPREIEPRSSGVVVGIGVDAVELDRFALMLERTPSTRDRLFTIEEIEYAASFVDPVPSLAARFAAREATMKSLGVGLGAFGFHDVWVRRNSSGQPTLMVEGVALDLARSLGVVQWNVSLTHTSTIAIAYVVAVGDSGNRSVDA